MTLPGQKAFTPKSVTSILYEPDGTLLNIPLLLAELNPRRVFVRSSKTWNVKLLPLPPVSPRLIVPLLEVGVEGLVRLGFEVITDGVVRLMLLLTATAGVAQIEAVISTLTTSPGFSEVLVKVLLFVPCWVLFTNHW